MRSNKARSIQRLVYLILVAALLLQGMPLQAATATGVSDRATGTRTVDPATFDVVHPAHARRSSQGWPAVGALAAFGSVDLASKAPPSPRAAAGALDPEIEAAGTRHAHRCSHLLPAVQST